MAVINSSLVEGGFEHAGGNPLANLMKIGGLIETATRDPENGFMQKIATDREGLEVVDNVIRDSLLTINCGVRAIGELLAFAADEVERSSIREIGWLIHGLGGLQVKLLDSGQLVQENQQLQQATAVSS